MPKIVTPNQQPAITTDIAAHHYRFVGIEITGTHSPTSSTLYTLVWIEYSVNGSSQQDFLSEVPTDIIFDRC